MKITPEQFAQLSATQPNLVAFIHPTLVGTWSLLPMNPALTTVQVDRSFPTVSEARSLCVIQDIPFVAVCNDDGDVVEAYDLSEEIHQSGNWLNWPVKGFTLIELLCAICVIAGLVALAVLAK